ncbi:MULTISPECIES: esterase/lipase family protein [Acinetobacter calcoaceticus/baumannii complex]|uniref:esterase/lipase family protein n=1 Tax=Acinetobacter calcoaceticus/baumannii complex TaxID=909768 RepID=UPI001B8183EA|nr:alpha/beta hydrolase [Acinetobacter nosocomialis]MBR7694358.1 alpha/beta hydrolase [Acinetobacter nosocomialis]HCT5804351.1 alpha/beta hydrolase [Acinetobacter nosocomialis]
MANKTIAQTGSATSPTTNKSGTYVEVPLQDTIPIIFVPGIMGSNIFNTALGKPVWMIGNGISGQVSTLTKQMGKSPAVLQTELDPLNTRVDTSGDIVVDRRLKLTEKTLRERYWGTVHWDSYGGILTYLQMVLNNVDLNEKPIYATGLGGGYAAVQQMKQQEAVYEWKSLLNQAEPSNWSPQESFMPVNQQEIEHLKKFHFPVYAMGYNWLQSSENGAAIVAQKLDKIKQEYGARFHKFIIVTHSMGGLLTRRLVQLRSADIAGVVHGVMPAEGAAAAYRRIVAGSGDVGALPAYVLGKNTEHVTAVLANAPGGLELLPSKAYNNGKPWLFLNGSGLMNGKDLHTNVVPLPKSDPYEEIYKADGVWWEMVKGELIDPAKKLNPKLSAKTNYNIKIDFVKKFHSKITNKYHPCTYVNYGHDSKHLSFGTLTWTLDRPLRGLTAEQMKRLPRATAKQIGTYRQKIVQEQMKKIKEGKGADANNRDLALENNGIRYISLVSGNLGVFSISNQNAAGDGTVPYQSGSAPLKQSGVKQVFKMTGFDHQGSYNNTQVRRSVLYSIVKIIKENNIQPKYR